MKVLGLDPGVNGGLASWDGETLLGLGMPTYKASGRGSEVDWVELSEQFDFVFGDHFDHAFVEKVGARPKDGGSSAFKFGSTYGHQRMLVVAQKRPITDVPPHTWKMKMGLNQDKKKSLAMARQLFPQFAHLFAREKDDGVAEAALLAYYGRAKLLGESVR